MNAYTNTQEEQSSKFGISKKSQEKKGLNPLIRTFFL